MNGLGFHNTRWSKSKDGLPVVGLTTFPSGESFQASFNETIQQFSYDSLDSKLKKSRTIEIQNIGVI